MYISREPMIVPFSSNVSKEIGRLMLSILDHIKWLVQRFSDKPDPDVLWQTLALELALEKITWGKIVHGLHQMNYHSHTMLKQHSVNLGPGHNNYNSRCQTDELGLIALNFDLSDMTLMNPPFGLWSNMQQNVSFIF